MLKVGELVYLSQEKYLHNCNTKVGGAAAKSCALHICQIKVEILKIPKTQQNPQHH